MKEIPLTKGYVAIVDDDLYEELSRYKWHAQPQRGKDSTSFYARAGYNADGRRIFMHRLVTGAKLGEYVDHINGNTLDNRRSNLRICTHRQNLCNQKPSLGRKYKGVGRSGKKWVAYLADKRLGTFDSERDAVVAYNLAAIRLHGEFARINKLDPIVVSMESEGASPSV